MSSSTSRSGREINRTTLVMRASVRLSYSQPSVSLDRLVTRAQRVCKDCDSRLLRWLYLSDKESGSCAVARFFTSSMLIPSLLSCVRKRWCTLFIGISLLTTVRGIQVPCIVAMEKGIRTREAPMSRILLLTCRACFPWLQTIQ